MILADADRRWLQEMLDATVGITLDAARSDRVCLRLVPVAQRAGLGSVPALLLAARSNPRGELVDQIVDAIATHETSWFRDGEPWKVLTDHVVPDVQARLNGQRPIRIWSAACSSGQEPYTMALALTERFGPLDGKIEILATDYSETMVAKAADGRYTQLEVNRGVPAKLLLRYFHRDGAYWRVNDEIRRVVTFERRNLARSFRTVPSFDIVCLRNVLIYFDVAVKARILRQVHAVTEPHGWLLLGSTETLLGVQSDWTYTSVGSTILYRPSLSGARPT